MGCFLERFAYVFQIVLEVSWEDFRGVLDVFFGRIF